MKKQMKLLLLISLLSFVLAGCEDTANTAGGTSSPDVTVSSSQKAGVVSIPNDPNQTNTVPDAKTPDNPPEENNSADKDPDANDTSVANDTSAGGSSAKNEPRDSQMKNDSLAGSESKSGTDAGDEAQRGESRAPESQEPKSQEPESKTTAQEVVIGEVAEGNIVTFGHYEQDNIFDNGPEPIEWRVLEVNDGKATLIPAAVLMWGFSREADEKTAAFYDEAFTDAEKLVISQQPQLMSDDMVKSYLKVKNKGANPTDVWYYLNDNFLYNDYTEYAVACGAKPVSVTYPGMATQTCYRFWTLESDCTYRVSKDDYANSISLGGFDRTLKGNYENTYHQEAICPYLIINTEGFE